MNYTPRYSICIPGDPFPVVRVDTSDRVAALAERRAGEVVYDWTTGEQVSE